VADTGAGMDEVTLKRATEPFFTTKGLGKGTGLGLSMVHGFAAQSGGATRIASRVGSGTTVELWLPVADRPAETAPVSVTPAPIASARRGRVLLVDDDPLVMSSTSAMLEDLGHSVVQATSAIVALTTLRAGTTVDLVVTDHAMPGLSGTELARMVRQSWPSLPILLVTGYPELPRGEDQGLPWLTKPFQRDALATRIDALLGADVATNVVAVDFPRRA
jgi:CheY-like chemotaxis protein